VALFPVEDQLESTGRIIKEGTRTLFLFLSHTTRSLTTRTTAKYPFKVDEEEEESDEEDKQPVDKELEDVSG